MNFTAQENVSSNIGNAPFAKARWSVIVSSMALLMLGCGGHNDPRGVRVGVQGNVTLDGKPLSGARIMFVSGDGGTVKAVAAIRDGNYEIAPEHGPLVGRSRVEIHPEMMELAQLEAERGDDRLAVPKLNKVDVPRAYNANSGLTARVSAEGENNFDFDLKSDPKR